MAACTTCEREFKTIEDLYAHICEGRIHKCGHCAHQTYGIIEMEKHLKECANIQVAKIIESEFDCRYCEHVGQKDFNIHKPEFQATGEYTKPSQINIEDPINPSHYKSAGIHCEPCGATIECIDICRNFSFTLGNVIKYIWRSDHKGDRQEQLKKAHWYLRDEIRKQEPDFDAND